MTVTQQFSIVETTTMDIPQGFLAKLNAQQTLKNSLVCVGLDPDPAKFPPVITESHTSIRDQVLAFNTAIIDATAAYAATYKPQSAFYEGLGLEGIQALSDTIDYLHAKYPEIPIILDAKRGDIGSTNAGYVNAAFDQYKVDALTVNPYLGSEALQPFLERVDVTSIILVRTSNTGSGELQDLPINLEQLSPEYTSRFGDLKELAGILGRSVVTLYEIVAFAVSHSWSTHNNLAVVVGATYPQELGTIRKIIGPSMPILIPGIGAQGGSAQDILPGLNAEKRGGIVSASRSILYASAAADFAEAAARATIRLRDEINQARGA